MTTVFDQKEHCSGCGACKTVCNENAITMQPDSYGFDYPQIDPSICVSCGKCKVHCHFVHPVLRHFPQDVFAVQSKDPEVLKKSQSGGLFAELAKDMLRSGGAVYGAAFTDRFEVCHTRIDSVNQLEKLQGSKYVQSKTEDIFSMVKNDLEQGVPVLFSGTPCQVAALSSYLGQKTALLYTVDLVCHGVMAPSLWADYLDYIKKKYGAITRADFRNKSFGWRTHHETFLIGKRTVKKNIYRKIFYQNKLLRPSCYSKGGDRYHTACSYAGMCRCSDLTVGDFWGIKQTDSFPNADLGISLCMVNTQNGSRLLERIKPNVQWERHNFREASAKQPHLSCSDDGVPIREVEAARRLYAKKGFLAVASCYGENGVRGLYPKGIRFLKHIRNKIVQKTGFQTERREKQ